MHPVSAVEHPVPTVFDASKREALRALGAFAVYLLLNPVWQHSGLQRIYGGAVLGLASWLCEVTQHFPLRFRAHDLLNVDFLVVLTLALFVVSTRLDWRTRLIRFGLALPILFLVNVVTIALQIRVSTAQSLLLQQNIQLLLPWEFWVVDLFKYLLYDVGLQLGPFVLVGLTAVWNSGWESQAAGMRAPTIGSRGARRHAAIEASHARRRRRQVTAAAMAALLLVLQSWSWWRESDPRHVRAHARMGHWFAESGDLRVAEREYRIALRGQTDDPEVYLRLAGWSSTPRHERTLLLKRGLAISTAPEWQTRFRAALSNDAKE